MQVVWMTGHGGPEVLVLGEAPDPEPGAGQVLIEVAYANVTFVETQLRTGGAVAYRQVEPPVVLGNGVGGFVRAVGAGVDERWVGKRVISSLNGVGGYAEFAVTEASMLVEVPLELALDEAVALLADGRTATMLVRAAQVRAGERVLVEAAAGGVGSLLVQLARNAGAQVIAVAGGPHKVEVARGRGADAAIDYRVADWPARVGEAVDVVFDGVGGEVGRAAFDLLAKGGRMLSYGLASGEWAGIPEEAAADRGVTLVRPTATPEELLGYVVSALSEATAGRLHPLIGQRFPLAQAAAAHTAIESRATIGKTLLVVNEP